MLSTNHWKTLGWCTAATFVGLVIWCNPIVTSVTTVSGPHDLLSLFGGKDAVECLHKPDRVRARLVTEKQGIANHEYDGKKTLHNNLDGLKLIKESTPAKPEVYSELSRSLLDEKMYEWGGQFQSYPRVDLQVTFSRRSTTVDVLIGFDNACVYVFRQGKTVSVVPASRSRLFVLAESLFPDEPLLQSHQPARNKLGPGREELIRTATRIEAYQIKPKIDAGGRPSLGDYQTLTGPVILSQPTAKLLIKVMIDPVTYDQGTTFSDRSPSVRLRFMKDKAEANLFICQETKSLIMLPEFEGESWGSSSCSIEGGYDRLAKLLKEVFSDK